MTMFCGDGDAGEKSGGVAWERWKELLNFALVEGEV